MPRGQRAWRKDGARTDRRVWVPGQGGRGLLAGSEAAPSCRGGNRGSAQEPAQDHRARRSPSLREEEADAEPQAALSGLPTHPSAPFTGPSPATD